MKATWPGAVARRMGLSGDIDFTPCRVGLTLHVPCSKGNHTVDVEVQSGLHPNGIAKRMLSQGWTFGSKLSCPEHSRRSPAAKKEDKPAMPAIAPTPEPSTRPQASDAAKKAQRLVFQALEDYYDETKKSYRPGYSDGTLAKETGAAPDFVRKIREEFFGPLGEPSELTELRTEVEALRNRTLEAFAELERSHATIRNRLAQVCKANGWPAPA